MPVVEAHALTAALDRGEAPAPVYLLHGEESFFIDELARYFEQGFLPEKARDFNLFVFYGKEVNLGHIVSYARRFPVMHSHQLILIKDFHAVPDLQRQESVSLLENYLEAPLSSTVLVLCHKNGWIDKRKRLYKLIEQQGVVVESKPLYDNQVPQWIESYITKRNARIEPAAVQLLFEHVGNNLSRLSQEINKILLNFNAQPDVVIESRHVQEQVGISREYNAFELQRAIGAKQWAKSIKIIHYAAGNPKLMAAIPTLALLCSYFQKLMLIHFSTDHSEKHLATLLGVHPFFVKEYLQASRLYSLPELFAIIRILLEADKKAKGVDNAPIRDAALLQEVILQISSLSQP